MKPDKLPAPARAPIWLVAGLVALAVALAAPAIRAWRRHCRPEPGLATMPASSARWPVAPRSACRNPRSEATPRRAHRQAAGHRRLVTAPLAMFALRDPA